MGKGGGEGDRGVWWCKERGCAKRERERGEGWGRRKEGR